MPKTADSPRSPARQTFPRASTRTRPLAVFGARGSGKTCYFASLYGHSSEGAASLTFTDPETERYLLQQWDGYESQDGYPGATVVNMPWRLKFELARCDTGCIWSAETLDHGGELIEAGGRAEDEDLRTLVRSWLSECEGVMVFLDVGTTDAAKALARRNEVSRLLNILREESDSARITKPLALVLTKWDEHGAAGDPAETARLLAEWDGNEVSADNVPLSRLLAYMREVPGYQQIRDTLKNFGRRCKVFLMSAVGTDRRLGRKPTSAFGLLPPLAWLLEQSDEERFASAKLLADRQSPAEAAATFRAMATEGGIEDGPVRRRIDERVRELRAKAGRRLRTKLGVIVGLAAVVLLTGWLGWTSHGGRRYEAWVQFVDSPEGASESLAERRLSLAQSLMTWHAFVLTHAQKTHLQTSILRDQEVVRDFNESGVWKEIDANIEHAERPDEVARLSLLKEVEGKLVTFGEKWGGRKSGGDWQARLSLVRTAIKAGEAQDEAFKAALARDKELRAANPPDFPGLLRHWKDFLGTNPPTGQRAKAAASLKEYEEAHDTQRVNQIVRDAAKELHTPEACGNILSQMQRVEKELHNTERHCDALSNSRNAVLTQADKLVYDIASQALTDARQSLKVTHILEARTRVNDYLYSPLIQGVAGARRPVKMRAEAVKAMKWLNDFQSGQDYPMSPATLVVPKGHKLFDNTRIFGGAEKCINYSLTLAGAVDYNPKKDKKWTPESATKAAEGGEKATIDLSELPTAPDLKFAPGSPDLTVVVWRNGRLGDWYSSETKTLSSDRFIPAVLSQGIQVEDGAKKELTLTIKCKGAEIPSLAPFRSGR